MAQDYPAQGLGAFRNLYPVGVPLSALSPKAFNCRQDPNLYPTHPSQTLKEYHRYDRAPYDARLLDGRDDQCLMSQINDRRPGVRPRNPQTVARVIRQAEEAGRRIPCQLGDEVHLVYLSDTYIDACGNYYRGVKRLTFLKSDENMGTLFSAGRTNYEVAGSEFNDRYDGDTYAVPHGDFFALAALLGPDMGRITQERARAQQTHRLINNHRIFKRK